MSSKKQRTMGHAAAKPTVDEMLSSRERLNRASTDFLKIDLETALTFVKAAQQTNNEFRKRRNRLAARKAYETIMKLISKVRLTTEDGLRMKEGLYRLKTALEELGEQF